MHLQHAAAHPFGQAADIRGAGAGVGDDEIRVLCRDLGAADAVVFASGLVQQFAGGDIGQVFEGAAGGVAADGLARGAFFLQPRHFRVDRRAVMRQQLQAGGDDHQVAALQRALAITVAQLFAVQLEALTGGGEAIGARSPGR